MVTLCMFFCSVKLFSAVAGPIGMKFGMRHEPDTSQVLRDFGGATPRDSEMPQFGGTLSPKITYYLKFLVQKIVQFNYISCN